jgi:undecaprenyl phosphate-alpha-L-ara4FN deformylase
MGYPEKQRRRCVLVGLRIDVDTFKGTRDGVPMLLKLLADQNIKGSFFFSVGPDNMGRHLWRLLRPSFLKKMLRSKAASLYGWDIIFRGTLWPGPNMGEKLAHVIQDAHAADHEIGLHAWDHHAWQAGLDRMDATTVGLVIQKGYDALTKIIGAPPMCSAVPSWKCNDAVLLKKSELPFKYNSDCRGESIFFPVVNGKVLSQPQIPATLPTYDEVIGTIGITHDSYNEFILSLLKPDKLNVLTIHAEVEGMALSLLFDRFLKAASSRSISFAPLGNLLDCAGHIETGVIVPNDIPGRDGWVAVQSAEN